MKHTEMKDLTPIKSNHKEVVAKVHESAEINSKIDMSGGGFEGKSNDIVYSDNAEYNYGSLSELYNNIDLSQYLASGITAIYYYDLSRFDDKTISEMISEIISNGAIPDVSPDISIKINVVSVEVIEVATQAQPTSFCGVQDCVDFAVM
jgi:hypothetical protein